MRGLHFQKETAINAVLDKNHQSLLNYLNLKIQFFLAQHLF
jgi:hypothetical protein